MPIRVKRPEVEFIGAGYASYGRNVAGLIGKMSAEPGGDVKKFHIDGEPGKTHSIYAQRGLSGRRAAVTLREQRTGGRVGRARRERPRWKWIR